MWPRWMSSNRDGHHQLSSFFVHPWLLQVGPLEAPTALLLGSGADVFFCLGGIVRRASKSGTVLLYSWFM